ncbi:MAG: hypothetical protein QM783_07415 [Phycisphaerales bacterium]
MTVTINRLSVPALVGVLAVAAGTSVASADLFTFTYTDTNGVVAGGNLDATDNGDGTLTCVTGDITFSAGPIAGTFPLFPGSGYSPSGGYIFNNILYTGPVSLDGYGLLFRDTVTGQEMNIWGNGGATNYTLHSQMGYVSEYNGTFILTAVPAPASAAALGVGLLASSRRRRV